MQTDSNRQETTSRGGTAIMVIPTLGVLCMVAAIVVVNEVNEWWVLLFAMLVTLTATLAVMVTTMRMLGNAD
jgi:uncharacterized protein (DUF983 family)